VIFKKKTSISWGFPYKQNPSFVLFSFMRRRYFGLTAGKYGQHAAAIYILCQGELHARLAD
jgi:hypothetical protein